MNHSNILIQIIFYHDINLYCLTINYNIKNIKNDIFKRMKSVLFIRRNEPKRKIL